ncbi:MAG: DNA topoisomerase I, partial [Candidatus Bathyarchaeia archaeon]
MKWQRLKHNGMAFPPPPSSAGLSIKIKGKKVRLTSEQEEMALALAGKKDTPHIQDEVFISNFLSDFLKTFPAEYANSSWRDIDFSEVFQYVDQEKQRKALLTREEKKQLAEERRQQRLALKEKYGYAEVNGKQFEIANWMAEPPCIFIGRGKHPLRGRWKPRISPKDVTLNLGEDVENREDYWKSVVHDHNSMWLACWTDKLSNKVKYVWLTDAAPIRQTRDRLKFDTAGLLETRIDGVRKHISKGMRAKDTRTRKVASVCYLVDKLCMRVGDEKEEDEADTVGASTLRVEPVTVN